MNHQKTILLFNPVLAKNIGLNESIVLQQLYYWHKKYDAKKWIYNTYEEWQTQFPFWSLRTIRRAFKSLEEQGLVKCKRFQVQKLYQLCLDKIKKFFAISDCPKRPSRVANLATSYMYTKTTTKINTLSLENTEAIKEERKSIGMKKEEGGITNKLVTIWEANIPSKGKGVILTKARENRLNVVFHKHFNSDLKQWEKFISGIKRSKFLMGEVTGFRIFLDWATKEENLLKIQEGNYLAKDEIEAASVEKISCKAISKLEENSVLDPRWRNMLRNVLKRFGEDTYISWFSKMELDSEKDGVLRIRTPSNFIKDWIDNNYGRALHSIGEQYFDGMKRICFTTN